MLAECDRTIDELIAALPGIVFTGDPVVNYLAPSALEKSVRLRTLLRGAQYLAAADLVERDLGPILQKLEDALGELVEHKVAPFEGSAAVKKVMELSREFQEVHRPELRNSVTHR
jgi:hypothetical protein